MNEMKTNYEIKVENLTKTIEQQKNEIENIRNQQNQSIMQQNEEIQNMKIMMQSLPLFYLYTVPMLFKTCIKKVKNFKT